MIVFEGEISENCKKLIWKREISTIFFICLFVAILFGSIIIAFSILLDWIISLFFILVVACPLLLFYEFVPIKKFKKRLPRRVAIKNDLISMVSEEHCVSKQFEDVKVIVDTGEEFIFNFYFPHKNIYFVCQKDLLKEGTLEEFEALFEGKIKRRCKKK